ncbi:hypothetical protein TRIP_B350492 [uncultured Desulfatiglans sp.]|uniref:Uncharacterized protein n=1 Tax=Uncultured Desulfatiglans sp. TaxID=1748965 RepID=A0A653AC26_UNCDX|nr:hypothetical protein TRIP_B350492 [uncultured Desulfatiglans sp.]
MLASGSGLAGPQAGRVLGALFHAPWGAAFFGDAGRGGWSGSTGKQWLEEVPGIWIWKWS